MLQIPPCTVSRIKMSHVCLICPKSTVKGLCTGLFLGQCSDLLDTLKAAWIIPHNGKTLDACDKASD